MLRRWDAFFFRSLLVVVSLAGRPIQTQSPRGDGAAGALVSDTFYDSAGAAYQSNDSYLAAITPGTSYFIVNEQNVPQHTVTTFDGAGRPVQKVVYNLNSSGVPVPFATTTTAYGGDRTDVTPPAGGVATSTYTDPYGNTIALRHYHGPVPTPGTPGSYDLTTYTVNNKNQLVTVTDPAGNQRKTSYDVTGRVISTTDPDSGPSPRPTTAPATCSPTSRAPSTSPSTTRPRRWRSGARTRSARSAAACGVPGRPPTPGATSTEPREPMA
ncbi:MAG TPA: hypothetical protein VFQ44_14455 [Streptosporangiaceae bacterium]|nr:hypothetical protein [Streptosporangiaceae bacterium]